MVGTELCTHQLSRTRLKGLQGFTRVGLRPKILADRLLETQALPASKENETKSDKKVCSLTTFVKQQMKGAESETDA